MRERRKAVVDIRHYTDPYCTWCWGSEPFLRKITETYGSQVSIRLRMVGMIKDTKKYRLGIPHSGVGDWITKVAEHWVEASNLHGMPVNTKMVSNLEDKKFSTYPPSLAFKAAEMQDRELSKTFLRRIREAAIIENKPIHRRVILVSLAEEVGLDAEAILEAMEDGSAENAFFKDLREAWSMDIKGFPTFILTNRRGGEVILRGYRRYSSFEKALEMLGGDTLRPRSLEAGPDSILEFIQKYKQVAFREVSVVFDLSPESTSEILKELQSKNHVKRVKAGNGYLFQPR